MGMGKSTGMGKGGKGTKGIDKGTKGTGMGKDKGTKGIGTDKGMGMGKGTGMGKGGDGTKGIGKDKGVDMGTDKGMGKGKVVEPVHCFPRVPLPLLTRQVEERSARTDRGVRLVVVRMCCVMLVVVKDVEWNSRRCTVLPFEGVCSDRP